MPNNTIGQDHPSHYRKVSGELYFNFICTTVEKKIPVDLRPFQFSSFPIDLWAGEGETQLI